jgi:DNA modification methylase
MSNENKITVLGKTFNSEEERKTWFREELRNKLPELKKMEGYPIGEDEDILNLSDPPYYTACPNPWLNDFVAEWEAEKKELEKRGLRKADFEVNIPFSSNLNAQKNHPLYNAHNYHTKVPHQIIMKYILYYTQPGDIVLDSFSGTGMTGVAINYCAKPDPKDIQEIKQGTLYENVCFQEFGERKVIQGDLSPLASFIGHNHTNKTELKDFKKAAEKIYNNVYTKLGKLFKTKYDNRVGEINYVIWSENLSCTSCNHVFNYWEVAVPEMGVVLNEFKCPNCDATLKKSKGGDKDVHIANKHFNTVFDELQNKPIKKYSLSPVLINCTINGKRIWKKPEKSDLELILDCENSDIILKTPAYRMPEGDEARRNDQFGYFYTNNFYTKRNLIIINSFYEEIKNANSDLKNYLLKWFTSSLNRLTLFNRFAPNHSRHVGPMANTLYVSGTPTEISAFYFFKAKIKENNINIPLSNNAINQIASAIDYSHLKSNSIDFIFTDPPFGANIMYSELNFISESWLKVFTNSMSEAICNRTQNKGYIEYQNLMYRSFKECFRVLKPGKWINIEFSNTSSSIWNAIQTSLTQAGFIVAQVFALNKGRAGLMGIIGPVAVNQDLLIACYKPSSEFDQKFNQHKHFDVGVWEFVNEHLEHLPIHLVSGNSTTAIIERSPKILFDRLIAFYVQRSLPVPIDAGKFQQGLRERFIERDGMFFTNEQVQEYDRKKAEVPNFLQLSIFVANEQDAIYWLRNILEKEPKTEQDLHPFWMKEVAGNMRKGDTLPEMRTILEENFLKNDKGQWYLPDLENEADLEKLRTRRLLKQFETYKTEAFKPKGKIKEARVEALRAGFKQCYQVKDFKTIVQIGDRIPNNLLMEDEVLLQFYDIASSRV